MIKVAVTEMEYDKAEQVFASAEGLECLPAPGVEDDLAEAVRSANIRHVVVGVQKYKGALYKALKKGGVIARFGVGHDSIDKDQATQAGLLCSNTPNVLNDSVAEHTIALMMAAARWLPMMTKEARVGMWNARVGIELRKKTLAVIGCGPIGCHVGRIAAFGFGMRVIGCEVRDVDLGYLGFDHVHKEFEPTVDEADFVSLHLPYTPTTHHFLSKERLAVIPKKAWIINTARGSVIDEAALFDSLAAEQLAGAALDVFENEPYSPVSLDKDLRTLRNVIMTPHVASSTQEACNRMASRALTNIRLAEQGKYHEMDLLNPEVLASL
jgi:phosphoglycerate dehydrogenase-like enzyme